MEYNKVIIGFVVQSYSDGGCIRQEFVAGDEVSREDPATGESIEVDVKMERYQSMKMVQPVNASGTRKWQEEGEEALVSPCGVDARNQHSSDVALELSEKLFSRI